MYPLTHSSAFIFRIVKMRFPLNKGPCRIHCGYAPKSNASGFFTRDSLAALQICLWVAAVVKQTFVIPLRLKTMLGPSVFYCLITKTQYCLILLTPRLSNRNRSPGWLAVGNRNYFLDSLALVFGWSICISWNGGPEQTNRAISHNPQSLRNQSKQAFCCLYSS